MWLKDRGPTMNSTNVLERFRLIISFAFHGLESGFWNSSRDCLLGGQSVN
jgi:hypothetical protein